MLKYGRICTKKFNFLIRYVMKQFLRSLSIISYNQPVEILNIQMHINPRSTYKCLKI